MNIAFFGQTGPYSTAALPQLLARLGPEHRVRAVVAGLARGDGRRPHRWHAPKKSAAPAGDDLVRMALGAGIETLETRDVNAAYVAHELARRGIHAIACAGFGCSFGPALLAAAPQGALNAHPSLLPRWRGPAPIFWALRTGDKRLGVSVHHIDALEDHGPLVAQEPFALRPRDEGATIFAHAGRLAGAMLATCLGDMAHGGMPALAQAHHLATRAPRPKPEDARVLPHDWRCEHLVNFACGAGFFRAPWVVLGGETYHLRTGVEAFVGRELPGEFVVQGDNLWVPCQDGVAWLRVQI